MPQTISFEATKVSAEKTAGEIEDMLRLHGCQKIGKEFENGKIKAIYFQMATADATLPFTLPVNTEAVYSLLREKKRGQRGNYGRLDKDQEILVHAQAERTAWRVIHWWLKSQLALIQMQMVTVTEVFLPYMLVAENQTLYQQLSSTGFAALMPRTTEG